MAVYRYTGENLLIMNKPKFIISLGVGWSATTPLWYTLQVQNKFVHAGLQKEMGYLDQVSYSPAERFKKQRESEAKLSFPKSRDVKMVSLSRSYDSNTNRRLPEAKTDIFLTKQDRRNIGSFPYTLDKYITYYKRLWETLQENNCPYQGVGDFSNANAWLREKFCHKLVDKLSEDFDVKALMIVRDPIRRLWSEIGSFWVPESPRQWKNIEEYKDLFFDYIRKNHHIDYSMIIEKWERVCPLHIVIMEQLWEGDQQDKEKQRLSDYLEYDIEKIHQNVYCPDRGPNPPHYAGLHDQWSSDKYWLSDELYNQVLPFFPIYQQWIDRYGSLPLYWGKPYNYE